MKYILLSIIYSASILAQIESTTSGMATRNLSQASECGGWGHMALRMEAQEIATNLANNRCRDMAEQISDYTFNTICTVDTYTGADIEIVTAKAKFTCSTTQTNSTRARTLCEPPLRQCGNRCCWSQ